jgi:hypothetical protein
MRPVRGFDNVTTFTCRLSWNLGASFTWNNMGLFRHVMKLLCFTFNLDLVKMSREVPPFPHIPSWRVQHTSSLNNCVLFNHSSNPNRRHWSVWFNYSVIYSFSITLRFSVKVRRFLISLQHSRSLAFMEVLGSDQSPTTLPSPKWRRFAAIGQPPTQWQGEVYSPASKIYRKASFYFIESEKCLRWSTKCEEDSAVMEPGNDAIVIWYRNVWYLAEKCSNFFTWKKLSASWNKQHSLSSLPTVFEQK